MSLPIRKVEIEVDPSAGLQPFFTLDDTVTGLLDGDFGLGGLQFADVTEYVVKASTQRGASRQLERFNAGNANVQLDNTKRFFDPLGDSPFSGQLLPRRGLRVIVGGTAVFTGTVDDWNLIYNPNGDNTSIAEASDGFSLLAQESLEGFTSAAQFSGSRINEILDKPEVNWPAGKRDIDTGEVFLQSDVIDDGQNVLIYLDQIAQTELGNIFITNDGDLRFQNALVGPNSDNLLIFSDDGTGVPFQDLQVVYGSELLFNRIVLTRKSGGTYVAEDLDSQNFYGVLALSQDDLLMSADAQLEINAERLLSRFKEPEYRFEALTVELANLTDTQQDLILSKELTDVVQVIITPNNIGDPIDRFAQIIGISHDINNFSHRITFNFRTLEIAPLVLNDAIFGKLDEYRLS
jgi:hypothetical protein